jgi:hypothetical protein
MQQVMEEDERSSPAPSHLEALFLNSKWTEQKSSERKHAAFVALGASGGIVGGAISASLGLWATGIARIIWSTLGLSAAIAGAAAALVLNGLQRRLPHSPGSAGESGTIDILTARSRWSTIVLPLGVVMGVLFVLVRQQVRSARAAVAHAEVAERAALDKVAAARHATEIAEKKHATEVAKLVTAYESVAPEVGPSSNHATKITRGFVFLGICSDHWVNPNFEHLPSCEAGALPTPVTITSIRGMKARAAASSEDGVGKEIKRLKAHESLLLHGMIEVSPAAGGLKIYWGEVDLEPAKRDATNVCGTPG